MYNGTLCPLSFSVYKEKLKKNKRKHHLTCKGSQDEKQRRDISCISCYYSVLQIKIISVSPFLLKFCYFLGVSICCSLECKCLDLQL